jgi:hypothetical protein
MCEDTVANNKFHTYLFLVGENCLILLQFAQENPNVPSITFIKDFKADVFTK